MEAATQAQGSPTKKKVRKKKKHGSVEKKKSTGDDQQLYDINGIVIEANGMRKFGLHREIELYCEVGIRKRKLKHYTELIPHCRNPVWNFNFSSTDVKASDTLLFRVYESDHLLDNMMGIVRLSVKDLLEYSKFELNKPFDLIGAPGATLSLSIQLTPSSRQPESLKIDQEVTLSN